MQQNLKSKIFFFQKKLHCRQYGRRTSKERKQRDKKREEKGKEKEDVSTTCGEMTE